jgi:ribose transport system ATP-binding protein
MFRNSAGAGRNVAHIFLGRAAPAIAGHIDRGRMQAEAARILARRRHDPRTLVHRLGVAQQMVEIAKALAARANPGDGRADGGVIRPGDPAPARHHPHAQGRRRRHHLHFHRHEIFEIGDRITVLRDGRKVAEVKPSETSMADLVGMMVGREVSATYRHRFADQPGAAVLEVSDLRSAHGVRGVSLVVRSGEIVGLAGLVGAGRTELVRAIFGADRIVGGEIRLRGAVLHGGPPSAVLAGVGLVPEDRKRQGLALVQSVQNNLLMAGLPVLFPSCWYRPARRARGQRSHRTATRGTPLAAPGQV